jgi:type 1 glutamine amidotransferase
VLIYSRTWGFRHDSIPAGAKALQMLGERTRAFTALHSEDGAMFEADKLNQFDAVIMLNTTGEALASSKEEADNPGEEVERRRENLRQFVSGGKGLLGIHAATDTMYGSKAYGDMIGGWFTGHPWHTEVPLKIDAPNHPLTTMFDAEAGFVVRDEIYQFAPRGDGASFNGYQPYSREKLRVLTSLDTEKFDVSAGARDDNDYAISWIQNYDEGRVFYSVLGHNQHIFWDPVVLRHYLAGIQFVLGDLPADATPK